ncbi:MAG: integrase core domain-containing protein [Proteobacteria bacterium]|nr:integrase core domain-containing protein [Pseudomonadota bacterium]
MDPGDPYRPGHFIHQVRFWGIRKSFAFIEQPQTNGVMERFNRTLKEQAINGYVFRKVEEVRRAVGRFVDLYNGQWRVEENGSQSQTKPGTPGSRPSHPRPRNPQT